MSRLVFAGPCNLVETSEVQCIHQKDDFYVFVRRKLLHGWTFAAEFNVETYSGPDTYTRLTNVYMQITKKDTVYAWGQNQATATVTAGERSLIVQSAPAPGYAGTFQVQPETIGGTIVCRSKHT